MSAALRPDPLSLLRDYEARARQGAAGLPRVETVREHWLGIRFAVAGVHLTVPVKDVREILNLPRLYPVPGTKPWIRGIANVRGRLLTVVDIGGFLTGRMTMATGSSRVLALRDESIPAGFLVEEMLGLKHFYRDTFEQDVLDLPTWLEGRVSGVLRDADGDWMVMDVAGLVHHPEFVNAAK